MKSKIDYGPKADGFPTHRWLRVVLNPDEVFEHLGNGTLARFITEVVDEHYFDPPVTLVQRWKLAQDVYQSALRFIAGVFKERSQGRPVAILVDSKKLYQQEEARSALWQGEKEKA